MTSPQDSGAGRGMSQLIWMNDRSESSHGMNGPDTITRDRLARQRTHLANERTLLAYVRTALGFVIVGIPAVWWVDHPHANILGGLSLVVGLLCFVLGLSRFLAMNRQIAHTPDSVEPLRDRER